MEVKIKTNNEMIDATIEMVDGVMVVSPIEQFVPKDGDVICVRACYNHITIFKDVANGCIISYADYNISLNCLTNKTFVVCSTKDILSVRLATEEEKKLLFDKIGKEGFTWDAEKKELVKKKWMPKQNEWYWSPIVYTTSFKPYYAPCKETEMCMEFYDKGWVFRIEEDCQQFCDRLNQVISNIKS